jgi:hypothetical protein
MLKKGLKDLLLADSNTTAFLGNRVRVGRLPQGSDFPTVVLKFDSSGYVQTLEGTNATQMRRVRFDCWGKTPRDGDELAQTIHNLLDSYRGVLSEGTSIVSCLPSADVDVFDEELKIAGVSVTLNIWYVPGEFAVGEGFIFPERDLDITDEDPD